MEDPHPLHTGPIAFFQSPIAFPLWYSTFSLYSTYTTKKSIWGFLLLSCIFNWTINSALLCSRMLVLFSNRTVSSLMRAEIYYPISSFMFPFWAFVLAASWLYRQPLFPPFYSWISLSPYFCATYWCMFLLPSFLRIHCGSIPRPASPLCIFLRMSLSFHN